MRSRVRNIGSGLLAAVLGVGAAVALAAGDDGVPACANKRSGEISVVGKNGRCSSAAVAITISGEAFRSSKRGTLTINGVAFKRTGTLPNSITINGNSFRTGTLPNTLTINGTSFRTRGGTLTINGIPATGGPGPTGPPGPEGRAGPTGPPGDLPGPVPVEVAGPVTVNGGTSGALATQSVSSSGARTLLVASGANLSCDPCPESVTVTVTREGAAAPSVARKLGRVSSFSLSELLVAPGTCGPCTYVVALTVPAASQGAASPVVSVSDIRLGLVDVGPVAP